MIHFFIGCFEGVNTGKGGHYYSLLALKDSIDCDGVIIVLGDFFPEAYSDRSDVIFIKASRLELPFLRDYLSDEKLLPQLIHAFDINSAAYAARVSVKHDVPLVVTKPGGPKQASYYLPYRNQIVFHKEDFFDFKSRAFKPEKLSIIPHRVFKPKVNNSRLNPFSEFKDCDAVKVICITRIGRYYEMKIKQAINLYKKMEEAGFKSVLAVVGTVEDESVLDELIKISSSHKVSFKTTYDFTHQASELLHFSDVVVGGGRSFMEAFSLGKPTFFPVQGTDIPCFAQPKNIKYAAEKNFSERLQSSSYVNVDFAFKEFMCVLMNDKSWYSEWSESYFDENFSAKNGSIKHVAFYKSAITPESKAANLVNLFFIFFSSLRKKIWR